MASNLPPGSLPTLNPASVALAQGNAVQYLIDTLSAAEPHSITVAMLGPQTNLALALIQKPDIARGIKEVVGVPAATDMITLLVEGHEAVCRTARALLAPADAAADESTADLVTQRLQVHEKTAWMLRSLLA